MNKWIKVSDRLPGDSDVVLVTFSGIAHNITVDHALAIATYFADDDEGIHWVIDDSIIYTETVVHAWMPLPMAYDVDPELLAMYGEVDASDESILKLAIATYGEDSQREMMIEECAELIQALSKMRRYPSAPVLANVLEEMADVSIMLDQLQLMYGDYEDVRREKINRLASRMKDKSGEAGKK